ncbi:zinc finger protein [Histomonas meleagridis]|uniref:zinc finger protein n=1 Tax=Histomonas meleagridis TaxID=135588 RepID=UPI003559846D|nr:zinc finger protein [Histomonas meleagridis]KAH0802161.1 zinc finger protein [Histomonas meleagridis]
MEAENPKFSCPYCVLTFKREGSLHAHIDCIHGDMFQKTKSYHCPLCDYTGTKSHLQQHIKAYHKNSEDIIEEAIQRKYFVCPFCSQTFKKIHTFRQHTAIIHEHKKPYSCDICGQEFLSLLNYKRHPCLKKSKDIKCSYCDAKLSSRKELTRHLKEEHKKPHVCPECGATFSISANLKQHMQKHSGSPTSRRKFACPVDGCNSAFTRQTNLNTHIKTIHGGVLPYTCDVCGAAFLYPSLLAKHAESHIKQPEPEIIEFDDVFLL